MEIVKCLMEKGFMLNLNDIVSRENFRLNFVLILLNDEMYFFVKWELKESGSCCEVI